MTILDTIARTRLDPLRHIVPEGSARILLKAEYENRRRLPLAGLRPYAREHGATSLEAYPVDPDSPSYRFGGFVPFFLAAGFREVGRAGTRRHVMRLDLRGNQGRGEGKGEG